MVLSKYELLQLIEDTWQSSPFSTWKQRDDQMHFRTIHVKYDWQIDGFATKYQHKAMRLVDFYQRIRNGENGCPPEELEDKLNSIREKIIIVAEKWRDTLIEIRGRNLGFFKRTPIGTNYYVDFDNGSDGNDGLSTTTAYKSLAPFLTNATLANGDRCLVRANMTEIRSADYNATDDGGLTEAERIKIIGCDSITNDPWGDASDVRPTINFNNQQYTWYFANDCGWQVERMIVRGSADAAYDASQITFEYSVNCKLKSCLLKDNYYTSGRGSYVNAGRVYYEDCDFEGNSYTGIGLTYESTAWLKNCRFNGGEFTQLYGVSTYGSVFAEGCSFGQTTPHNTADIIVNSCTVYVCRNCVFNKFVATSGNTSGIVVWENCTGLPSGYSELGGVLHYAGVTMKVTDTLPSGKTGFSLKQILTYTYLASSARDTYGLMFDLPHSYGPMPIYLDAGTYTVTVKIRAAEAFSVYPTASELFLRASYYDDPESWSTAEVESDEVLSDGSTWVDFNVTFTHERSGIVWLDVRNGKYENGKGIYVYPVPEISNP